MDLLKLELEELHAVDFDLELTGFDAGELGDIWLDGDGGDFDPDEDAEATRLDETTPKMATCPHCGHVFELKE